MGISNLISLLGGVALFLFGMSLMGDGLKKVAGNSMEMILFKLSSTPLKGLLLGMGVTAVIQSSSATSVMVVGFVNSGIMKLSQAIAVILGSMVGTSITGWIISLSSIEGSGWVSLFSTSTLSAGIAVIGIIFRMFTKDAKKKHVGDIMLGFAVLMYGMQAMSGAVSPLRSDPGFVSILTAFSNPILGILVGIAFSAVLQSASAAVGILQALSFTGVITFSVAFPILLGISVGASAPVLMAAIGAKVNGKRSALAYLIMSLSGAVVCGIIFYAVNTVAHFSFVSSVVNTVDIALVNTVFRLAASLLLLPFLQLIARILTHTIQESDEEKAANEDFDRLDDRLLSHPEIAIEQSRLTVDSMAAKAMQNLIDAINLLFDYSNEGYQKVEEMEDYIDRYEDKIGTYLMKLNAYALDQEQNERMSLYLHTISDFERISDHAMNIADVAQEIQNKKIQFSEAAQNEIWVLTGAVKEILKLSVGAFLNEEIWRQFEVEPLEERVDVICDQMKMNHIDRMQEGICSMNQGFIFNDLITNLERVADHCSNIAIAMIEIRSDEYETHEYITDLKAKHGDDFDRLYQEYESRYAI